jgi:hypothetical protein
VLSARRRGVLLPIVLAAMLGLAGLLIAAMGRIRDAHLAMRARWDAVVVDAAALEIEAAARRVCGDSTGTLARELVTTNRLFGRLEVAPVAASGSRIFRVRWAVGGAANLWREGTVLGIAVVPDSGVAASCAPGGPIRLIPRLPIPPSGDIVPR